MFEGHEEFARLGNYEERIRWLIERRSYHLHRSGSVSHLLLPKERDKVEAYHKAQAALLKEQLVTEVVVQYPDKRPEPLPEIWYEGKRMVIQRYDGVTCVYVSEDKFDESKYSYTRPDYHDHVAAEISRH